MTRLPIGTFLGELELVETFVYFDAPRVFTCRRLSGQCYFAEWVGELEDEDGDDWLYVPVSTERMLQIRSGGIALRAAFVEPEDQLFYVRTHYNGVADTVRIIRPAEVEDEWLPDEDFSLSLPTPTRAAAATPQELTRQAVAENRTRVRLELDRPDEMRTESSTRNVGALLVDFQHLMDNVGFSIERSDGMNERGRIPFAVTRQTESEVVELRAASFVIELAASVHDNPAGDSLFTRASEKVLELLDTDLDRHQLTQKVSSLGPRAAKSFRRFIETVSAAESTVTIAAAGQRLDFKSETLSGERIEFISVVLKNAVADEESTLIVGEMNLYAYNSNTYEFGLRDSEGNEYTGRVEKDARPYISNPTIDRTYRVTLVARTILDEAIGQQRVRYRLRQLSPADATN